MSDKLTTTDFIEQQLEAIDEQIQAIDNHKVVRAAERLLDQKKRLMGARAALLGAGPRLTGGNGGNRMTQEEVVSAFTRAGEGSVLTVEQLSSKLSTSDSVVRGHLNRGKDERFLQNPNNRSQWALRDPENDHTNADDVEWE